MVAIFGAALIALSVCAAPTSVARAQSSSRALRFEIVKRTAYFAVVERHHQRFRVKHHARNAILNGVDRYRVVRRTRRCIVLRPVPRRTSTLNVRDYGAAGNGRTDDTGIVQSAITAAAASGGVVYFPAGTYLVGPLTVPAGVVLQGVNGQGYYNATAIVPNVNTQSRLKLKSGSTRPLISPSDDGAVLATHVRIFDLALDCNGLAQPAINLPDRGDSISRFWLVERCYVVNSGQSRSGYAVYIGNLNTACTLRDCVILNGTSGSPAGCDGVGWYGQDGLMEDCFIGYCTNTGLKILGGASYMTFTMRGGGVFACTTGIVVAGRGAIIDGVSVDHNFNDGIYFELWPLHGEQLHLPHQLPHRDQHLVGHQDRQGRPDLHCDRQSP